MIQFIKGRTKAIFYSVKGAFYLIKTDKIYILLKYNILKYKVFLALKFIDV